MAAVDKAQKRATPKDVDSYLASMSYEARMMLEEIRSIITAGVPEATEGISYGMPVFKYRGNLVWMGGYKKHCSLFGIGSATLDLFEDELEPYRTPKGALHFRIGSPIPAGLVTRLMKARVEENESAGT